MYALAPSLVRFPFASYVSVCPFHTRWRFALSYDADVSGSGSSVRANDPPTASRLPIGSYWYVSSRHPEQLAAALGFPPLP